MYVTRIAPSPTGDMHVGTARTAYFNWLAARATGGKFILRIDDTDPTRSKPEYIDVILETMRWLGLDWDEIFYQSTRYDRYRQLADFFIEIGIAEKVDGAVRFKLPEAVQPGGWHDLITGHKKITDDDRQVTDKMVLIRSDGSPTYNWASVIDDADFGVNLIIRGTDHITNTSKQVLLWHHLGYTAPQFAHVGLIGEKGKPLSKREGAASMLYYREKGYDPDAVLNFLARLGWAPTVDNKTTKTLSRQQMLQMFLTAGKMKANLANMELHKLEALDRKYKAQKGEWRTGEKLIGE